MNVPRLVIAGTASGVGKTTTAVALTAALRARGLSIATFKCGPDYLDPSYLARASERPCWNLDPWMMGREGVLATFARSAAGADLALVEGMMGLFDGIEPETGSGSTAELARWLSAPVLLACDAGGMAGSIAALARGFAQFDPALDLVAVAASFAGGAAHRALLERSLQAAGAPPLLGGLPRDAGPAFAERHLGLVRAGEGAPSDAQIAHWGAAAEEHFDVARLMELARAAPALARGAEAAATAPDRPRCRVAVARDAAFHFTYDDDLRRLELAGAELVFFSPVADRALPEADGLILPGGYPELHAEQLAANAGLRASLRAFADSGRPIYAECGGLMALCQAIRTADGRRHPMLGLLPGEALVQERLAAIGYVEVELAEDTLLGPAGARFRGHQFRYSILEGAEAALGAYRLRSPAGAGTRVEGYRRGSVLASWVHAAWASNPRLAEHFVARCTGAREASRT